MENHQILLQFVKNLEYYLRHFFTLHVRVEKCQLCHSVCFLRAKTARVITFEQFNQALTELAPKRFKGKSKEEALQQLYGLLVGKEPANMGVTVSISSVITTTYLFHMLLILESRMWHSGTALKTPSSVVHLHTYTLLIQSWYWLWCLGKTANRNVFPPWLDVLASVILDHTTWWRQRKSKKTWPKPLL